MATESTKPTPVKVKKERKTSTVDTIRVPVSSTLKAEMKTFSKDKGMSFPAVRAAVVAAYGKAFTTQFGNTPSIQDIIKDHLFGSKE